MMLAVASPRLPRIPQKPIEMVAVERRSLILCQNIETNNHVQILQSHAHDIFLAAT